MSANERSNSGNSHDEPLTHEQVQQVLRAGEQAAQLLNSPVYNLAYQQLMNRKFQEWVASSAKEVQRRESLYMQVKGLTEVTELLAGAVEDAVRLEQERAAENDPQRARKNYVDQQGFGLNLN